MLESYYKHLLERYNELKKLYLEQNDYEFYVLLADTISEMARVNATFNAFEDCCKDKGYDIMAISMEDLCKKVNKELIDKAKPYLDKIDTTSDISNISKDN